MRTSKFIGSAAVLATLSFAFLPSVSSSVSATLEN